MAEGAADGTTQPKTLAEQLDAAGSGEQFGRVLSGFFTAVDRARAEER